MFEKMIRSNSAKMEQQLENWLDKYSAEHPFPPDVRMQADIDYAGDGAPCHRMDLYLPAEARAGCKLPVLFNIHGGGFLLGKKEANRLFCADMCRRGFIVFCAEYPLVPDVDIFEVFRSLTLAVNAASGMAERFGGDMSRFYLCGDSAGAYLCVYLAAMRRNTAMAAAAGASPIKADVKALGLISGMFYTTKLDNIGIFLPGFVYGKGWRKGAFRPYTNPEYPGITNSLPPSFLVTAKGDYLRHYSRNYARALKKSGTECILLDFDGEPLPHAFAAMNPDCAESQEAIGKMADFLLAHS